MGSAATIEPSPGAEPARPAGRPRSSELDEAIAEATFQLLGEKGYSGLTIAGIAESAGTTTAAIYRRWDSKPELVSRIVFQTDSEAEAEDTGDLHDDLVAMVRAAIARLARPSAIAALGGLLSEPAPARHERTIEWTGASAPVIERLERAKEAGDLRSDVDPRMIEAMITGPVLQYTLMGHTDPSNEAWAQNLVSLILRGARP